MKLFKRKVKNPKIVILGGGTGLSVVLRGLKTISDQITAIVTVADDGGGSGVLREDLGMLPPGDIRNCIIALANTEPVMEKLLQYRFPEGQLKGQSFGNLFIAAMNGVFGNFEMAIKEMSNILAVTGKVLPMTLEDVQLFAKLEDGTVIKGESNIPHKVEELGSPIDHIFIKPVAKPLQEALEAIEEADIIILGPGSLYTSVMPNLLVKGIAQQLYKSNALKVYVPNIMTQPGETDGYDVIQHIDAILKHTKQDIVDCVIVNNGKMTEGTLAKYKKDGSVPVYLNDEQRIILENMHIKFIESNLVDISKNYIRHDAKELSLQIMKLLN